MPTHTLDPGEDFEQWLDRQLTGDLATGNLETELRMAVATILNMPKIPKDYAVQPLIRLIDQYMKKAETDARIDELKHVFHVDHDNLGTNVLSDEYIWVSERLEQLKGNK